MAGGPVPAETLPRHLFILCNEKGSVARIYFRHDALRTQQKELIADAHSAIGEKRHLLAHAPVGMGKTDSLLSPAISYALEHNKTVFFLTPKISQHRIAMEVVQGLAKKYNLESLRAVDLIGRKYACIDPILSEMDAEGFYQSCERRRKKEECAFFRNAKGFTRLDEARAERTFKKVERAYGCGMHHGQLVEMGRDMEACPYEWLTKLAASSNVIIADYFHMMLPYIRDILLAKIKKKMSNSIIIVDEAHNLAKRVRDQLSFSTNSFFLSRMDKELKSLGIKSNVNSKFNRWAKYTLGEAREKLVMREMFFEALSNEQFTPEELADYLESCGEAFIEATNKKSFALRFSRFLHEWIDDDGSVPSVRILRKRGESFYLSKKALDPSSATSRINDAHSAILTSGTLLPLQMHRDVLGLDASRTSMKQYPSPFSKSSKLNIILEGFTTRYSRREPGEYKRMAQMLDVLVSQSPGGTALFFPSYKVMGSILPFMKSRSLQVQKERMGPSEISALLSDFRRGGTLCCVQGGSLSEGLDYSQGEIKTAVIVGIALEEMSLEVEALIDHYDDKFGRGWDYGYLYPGVIKAVQSAGRAIRKESDRAAIIYMDERFNWKNYRPLLPKEERFTVTSDPNPYMEKFWEKL